MSFLEVRDVHAGYAPGVDVLHGISLAVAKGELVALIGANGAGKTTTLRTITGLLPGARGDVVLDGTSLSGLSVAQIAALGVALVPEGRGIFPGLTVYENLEVATTTWFRRGMSLTNDLDDVYRLFPILAERRQQLGWSLSGGQQQMLAIGRALMARPRLLLLDEPSLGLAPNLVRQVFAALKRINERGTTVLLVEQNAFMALKIAHRAYALEMGRVVIADTPDNLRRDGRIRAAYLGG